MPALPRTSILILNHNGRQHLEACLPSLEAQAYPKDCFEIEVIDNGSSDESIDMPISWRNGTEGVSNREL